MCRSLYCLASLSVMPRSVADLRAFICWSLSLATSSFRRLIKLIMSIFFEEIILDICLSTQQRAR
jgi:hypothetical protein